MAQQDGNVSGLAVSRLISAGMFVAVIAAINLLLFMSSCNVGRPLNATSSGASRAIYEVNVSEVAPQANTIAITGALIIDGNGGKPISNGCVIVRNGIITEIGINGQVSIPDSAEIVDASGMSLMPGLIDAHFHLDNIKGLPALFLQNGVTSLRDPGAWIEKYAGERGPGKFVPRLFLSGPHIDMFPPAYPADAFVVRDGKEAARQVNKAVDEGASVIKVYFRLPPAIIEDVTKAAHERGIPVTAHLETTEAIEAIEAGLDGIEHITSFGLSLVSRLEAEKYRQSVLRDNNARRQGRYAVWKEVDVNGHRTDSLVKFLAKNGAFVTPTLGPFEYQFPRSKVNKNGDENSFGNQPFNAIDKAPADSVKFDGFNKMKAITARMQKEGVRIVVGSHSMVAYAEKGWAYQREMELLVESGISPSDVIVAATIENARFFRIDERLGSIEKGKIADLILVAGNPLEDIRQMRNVYKVMLNGVWVKSEKSRNSP